MHFRGIGLFFIHVFRTHKPMLYHYCNTNIFFTRDITEKKNYNNNQTRRLNFNCRKKFAIFFF